jgi:hypothetical protein
MDRNRWLSIITDRDLRIKGLTGLGYRYSLPITYYPLPTTHYPLPITPSLPRLTICHKYPQATYFGLDRLNNR